MKTGSIYRIYNRIDGKSYIGATTKDVEKTRIKYHLSGWGACRAIVEAVNEHGYDAFGWEIIESNIESDRLKQMEIHYICAFNTLHPNGYNLMLGRKPCDQTRLRISKATKGKKKPPFTIEHRRKLSEAQRRRERKPFTAEHRRNLSAAQRGKKDKRFASYGFAGKTHSPETRQRMSQAKKGKR